MSEPIKLQVTENVGVVQASFKLLDTSTYVLTFTGSAPPLVTGRKKLAAFLRRAAKRGVFRVSRSVLIPWCQVQRVTLEDSELLQTYEVYETPDDGCPF